MKSRNRRTIWPARIACLLESLDPQAEFRPAFLDACRKPDFDDIR